MMINVFFGGGFAAVSPKNPASVTLTSFHQSGNLTFITDSVRSGLKYINCEKTKMKINVYEPKVTLVLFCTQHTPVGTLTALRLTSHSASGLI